MMRISILKVESPSCLLGRVVQGPGADADPSEQYHSLLAQMNLFYSDVTQDQQELRPTSLEEGQACVVYWAVVRSWCRAVVESIIRGSVSCQARCLLVDHGEQLVVPSDQVRVAMQDFLQLPSWVRRFHLAGITPTTLRVSVVEEKAELVRSTQWDSSATLYLHKLLQASTETEAVILETEPDSTSVELYLTVGNIKICVNDDLVAKKFAFYTRDSADGDRLEEVDRVPLSLHSPKRKTSAGQTSPVTSPGGAAAGAGDWPTPPSQPHCRSKVTAQPLSEGDQSQPGSVAAADGDSSEDTDSSLAEALTRNLSLFRFLKYLNPGSGSEQPSPRVSEGEGPKDSQPEETDGVTKQEVGACGAEGLQESAPAECPAEEPTRSEETWRSEEDWACSRLLEWLNPDPLNPDPVNPDPLNPDPGAADEAVPPTDPSRSGVLVQSVVPLEPWSSLEDAPISDALRWVLRVKQYSRLPPADRYSWPAVARGCNTVVVSHGAEQPLSYLVPLITHVLLSSIHTSSTSSSGPVAVLLCPGWEKVQVVFDLLEDMKVVNALHPTIALLGVGKDEAEAVKIPKNCLLLVTTPFSLLRLLSTHCFLFMRLHHLVLDEADQLFSLAPDQMAAILQHFQKVTSSGEEKASFPQQLVAVARRWSTNMEEMLANHMPSPCVVMTVPEEAALYGGVQQIILMATESTKTSVLLGVLDFNPDVGQKTLIVAGGVQEVEDVFKAVSKKSAFCLLVHEEKTHQVDFVLQQWRKDIGPGTHVILVTTSGCLKSLGVSDASCVVHYDFPASPKAFGTRLFCMNQNFRGVSDRVSSHDQKEIGRRPARSVLLISERNARHVVGVLRYLMRTDARLPPELLAFADGVHQAREDQKTQRPLCSLLKSFGVCRDVSVCPDRHRWSPALDQSELPAAGVIQLVPLYIKTASVFYGRILRKEDAFQTMEAEMTRYYGDKKPGATDLLEGGLYAVEEDGVFSRVRILSVPDRGDRLFFSVSVLFIDVGKEEEVKAHQVLQLPEHFHALPPQAVEMIVCRVRPVDSETNWHPKVTRAVSQKIRGRQHRARAVFSLGNTVFVDPMVQVTQVPGVKTLINEYNVQSEILSSGMGERNPEHLDLLRALSQEGRSPEAPVSLEVQIRAQEEVLTRTDPSHLEPPETLSPASPESPALDPAPPPPTPAAEDQHHLDLVCVQEPPMKDRTRDGLFTPGHRAPTDNGVCFVADTGEQERFYYRNMSDGDTDTDSD